jgi:hypothetical protein
MQARLGPKLDVYTRNHTPAGMTRPTLQDTSRLPQFRKAGRHCLRSHSLMPPLRYPVAFSWKVAQSIGKNAISPLMAAN